MPATSCGHAAFRLSLLRLSLCLFGTLPAACPAQTQTIVSPLTAATTEGASNNVFPWSSTTVRRYLQIHSDIGGIPKFIKQLAWRKEGTYTPSNGTAAVDVELFLGDSVDWDHATFVIGNNFLGPKTTAVARKIVNLGPLSGSGTPSPFDIKITLDQTYLYIGNRSLAWEAVVYNNQLSSFQGMDAEVGSVTVGTVSATGTGCIASGQTSPMTQTVQVIDACGTFALGGHLRFGPPSALAVLEVGATNPNLTFPGLCGPLLTDMLVGIPLGTTDPAGFIGATSGGSPYPGGAFALVVPNTFPGAVVTTQVLAVDLASTMPIPVACSNGASFTVPASNLAKVCKVARIFNNDGGTSATSGIFFTTSSVGHSLPTEFTY